eukprot:TRINITY_DN4819_c0_g1_i1.p1 TRINITY_DN4819_c0_g1~~TRINITY_DN4819_c0_g1_i1.p1  ORF type:complete len:418 (-),score=94.93 TRINITY_DN4819_c0_g1_i1:393-1613(-)
MMDLEEEHVEQPQPYQRKPGPCANSPFNRLSKRQKTLVIVCVSFALLLALIVIIVIPITRESSTSTRTYYIAAVEDSSWKYAAEGHTNEIYNRPFTEYEQTWTHRGGSQIGSTYQKARYREYTDEQFQKIKEPAEHDRHTGILGPVVRAEVGDTIRIVFANKLRFPVTFQVTGLSYSKKNAGTVLPEGEETEESTEESTWVKPESTKVYEYKVTRSAGPGIADPDSIVWTYFSTADEKRDVNTGLIGPIVVASRGDAFEDGSVGDAAREVFVLAGVLDENESYYLSENYQSKSENPNEVDVNDPVFIESNKMHMVNGFVYGCNPHSIEIPKGKLARWYFIGVGEQPHSIRFLGAALDVGGFKVSTIYLFSGATLTADMEPDEKGTFLFEAIGEGAGKGMAAVYEVV